MPVMKVWANTDLEASILSTNHIKNVPDVTHTKNSGHSFQTLELLSLEKGTKRVWPARL